MNYFWSTNNPRSLVSENGCSLKRTDNFPLTVRNGMYYYRGNTDWFKRLKSGGIQVDWNSCVGFNKRTNSEIEFDNEDLDLINLDHCIEFGDNY